MLNIFWNHQERRLRAGWRILVEGLAYFALLSLLPWLTALISNTVSDTTGLTGKIADYVSATGNFPVAETAPDYLTRVNNYARMSYNFGPTLLRWMQEKSPECYAGVLAADRESRERFSGHGSAMAQGYNHAILPLMNRRDRVTQVLTGELAVDKALEMAQAKAKELLKQ
jgi:hypothetical protein